MTQKVFETEWFSIEALPYPPSDKPYYRLRSKESVTIIAFTDDQKIVLVKQYRPAIDMTTLEMPAGDILEGETLEQAVQRELTEESGYRCDSVKYLGAYRVAPDRILSRAHLFFGKGAKLVPGYEREAGIEPVLIDPKEFEKIIISGDFFAVSGIAIYSLAKLNHCI